MSKRIPLTQGEYAIVDDDDFEWLLQYKWCLQPTKFGKYAKRRKGLKQVRMHREILGVKKGEIVDHINRNGLDNRKKNLRVVTQAENAHNHGGYSHNTSGVNGVNWDKRYECWKASILSKGKRIHVGYFATIEEATEARRKAELEYWGELRGNPTGSYGSNQ